MKKCINLCWNRANVTKLDTWNIYFKNSVHANCVILYRNANINYDSYFIISIYMAWSASIAYFVWTLRGCIWKPSVFHSTILLVVSSSILRIAVTKTVHNLTQAPSRLFRKCGISSIQGAVFIDGSKTCKVLFHWEPVRPMAIGDNTYVRHRQNCFILSICFWYTMMRSLVHVFDQFCVTVVNKLWHRPRGRCVVYMQACEILRCAAVSTHPIKLKIQLSISNRELGR